jgi:hypothetical protein
MAIVYQGMAKPGDPNPVEMNETNIGPALILWLLFVTNPKWFTDPDRDVVAKKLGVTRSVVDYYYDAVANTPAVKKTATVFSSIAHDVAEYGELGCPFSPDTVLALAGALPALRLLGKKKDKASAKKKPVKPKATAKKNPSIDPHSAKAKK